MKRNPERKRDVGAGALMTLGTLDLTLAGYYEPTTSNTGTVLSTMICSAVFIGGGALCEKGTRQIMKERLAPDQVSEAASLQIEYEI